MRIPSHCLRRVAWAIGMLGIVAGPCLPSGATPDGHWRLQGAGIGMRAAWVAGTGRGRVSLHCDQGDPVLLLRVDAGPLPHPPARITLQADGTAMDYPVSRAPDGVPGSRIALDAPILDRMLVARRFAVSAGGRTLATGSPGAALVRVAGTCRALHWPREARIEPSDAGFAKK